MGMDPSKKQLYIAKLKKMKLALENNRMLCDIVDDETQARELIAQLIPDGSKVSVGGSQTLFETGIIDQLRTMNIDFLDRYELGLDRKAVEQIYRDAFSCDYYLASSNAVTLQGELYNIDGNGNRVAAMIYGPRKVILVVGINKVVADMEEAQIRLRQIACPANNIRIHVANPEIENPCIKAGKCVDCQNDTRICSSFVRLAKQRVAQRIHVIVIMDNFGF